MQQREALAELAGLCVAKVERLARPQESRGIGDVDGCLDFAGALVG